MPEPELDPRTALIQDYVRQERRRCMALVSVLHAEVAFLIYCIDYSVYPDQVEDFRERFEQSRPVDDLDDLLS